MDLNNKGLGTECILIIRGTEWALIIRVLNDHGVLECLCHGVDVTWSV